MSHLSDEDLLSEFRRYGHSSGHVQFCPACQARQAVLIEAIDLIVPQPLEFPSVDAQAVIARARGTRRAQSSWSLVAVLALAGVLALGRLTAPLPLWPAPVALSAIGLPFSSSHVDVQWRPGDAAGRIHTEGLIHRSREVLEVWMVSGTHHVPVTDLPLTPKYQTVIFSVPAAARNAHTIGITLEPSPNMPVPTGPRVFGYRFS